MERRAVQSRLTDYLYRKASAMGIPLSGAFELTPVCNMNCRMCYVRMTASEQQAVRPLRTAGEWLHLAERLHRQGMVYLLLTGGEPFTHPEIRTIIEGLHRMGFVLSLNTNGTMIDEKTVEWLKNVPPSRMNITLYGASDAAYHRLCGNPEGFSQVMRGIHLLKAAGIPVKINCSVTPYNAADLDRIIEICREEELILQTAAYMFPPVRRDREMVGQNDRLSPEEAAWYTAKTELLMNGTDSFIKRYESGEIFALPADTAEDCIETEGEGMHCRAGKCSFWITWEGTFLICGMLPVTEERNVFESDFSELWSSARTKAAEIRLPAECKHCGRRQFCRACAAMVYTETGSFDRIPEYRCRMAYAYPEAIRFYMEQLQSGKTVHEIDSMKEIFLKKAAEASSE